jgi:hypothetical protein
MLAWPKRFPRARIKEYEYELGHYAFAGQYQQSPVPRKGGIFKREYWQPYVVPSSGKHKGQWPEFDFVLVSGKREGCTTIRSEKRSGTSTANREELRTVLDFLRKGDVLMVTRIDRLARSIGDLQDIVRAVRAKGASLKATEQPIDTSTAAGKCFLDMLGVFAEFETNLRRQPSIKLASVSTAG